MSVKLLFEKGGPDLAVRVGTTTTGRVEKHARDGSAALIAQSPTAWAVYSYRLPSLITITFPTSAR